MAEIKEVHPREDYQLEVSLTNGGSITLNLKPKLETIRFGLLKDAAFFRRVETDGTVIRWGSKVELSTSEVFEMIKK
ncbi:DUF2442 domain-containing protein [Anaerovorax odorimutans]|uniref:DUF2442 domain-containing protein n=1 Tax=Anaerovorax odorimutans TaxID=109327 RepID=UPI000486D009|nr:DUF2442 domain-containing protein [Anaerovorax odorimutans]